MNKQGWKHTQHPVTHGEETSCDEAQEIARSKRKVGCVKGDSLFVLHTFVLFEFLQACIQVFV